MMVCQKLFVWDYFVALLVATELGKDCVAPELSRVINFGEVGGATAASLLYPRFFANHSVPRERVPFTRLDLNYTLHDAYYAQAPPPSLLSSSPRLLLRLMVVS